MGKNLYRTSSHDLFSDAFFIYHDRLMFASLHGRESNVLSLMGCLTNQDSTGFNALGFRTNGDENFFPKFTTAGSFLNLSKRVTKYTTHNYGILTHIFLYADELLKLDEDIEMAWILFEKMMTIDTINRSIWSTIQKLSKIPLLDSWKDFLLEALASNGHIIKFMDNDLTSDYSIIGVTAVRINLPEDFSDEVSNLLRSGKLVV